MRSELHEPGCGRLTLTVRVPSLAPLAVDAAMADDSPSVVAQRGSRRECHAPSGRRDASRVSIDQPHALANDPAGDAGLIRQLSRQLCLLEAQQNQIRRLLELTERRFAPQ